MRSSLLTQAAALALVTCTVALLIHFTPQIWGASHSRQNTDVSLGPARLIITKINLNAPIESVGMTPDGAMDTPKSPDGVAWYRGGSRPGEIGSAVIDGHSGWKDGKAAAFDNLYKLRPGDSISVESSTGSTTVFIVREIRSYDPGADDADVFASNDGKAHLNLITCEGVWDATSKTYSKRLVVFTDKDYE